MTWNQSNVNDLLFALSNGREFTAEELSIYTDITEEDCNNALTIMSINHPIKFNDDGLVRRYYLDKSKFHTLLQKVPQHAFDEIKRFVKRHGECTTEDVTEAFKISNEQADIILTKVSMRCNNIQKSIVLTIKKG